MLLSNTSEYNTSSTIKSTFVAKTTYAAQVIIPILIKQYTTRMRRYIALLWIMTTQKEGVYYIERKDFILTSDNIDQAMYPNLYQWRKLNCYNYHMDTDRSFKIFDKLVTFVNLPQINLPCPIPWHIIKKINEYIAPNNICNIFKKEALTDDYRMYRTYDEISNFGRTTGFTTGENSEYDEISDWRVGVRNGEIVSSCGAYSGYTRAGGEFFGFGYEALDHLRQPYSAKYKKGFYYSDEDSTSSRGVPGDLIRPWWNRKHDTFYVFNFINSLKGSDVLWGSGPNKLVWNYFYKKTEQDLKLSPSLDTHEVPTELLFRKIHFPFAICLGSYSYQYSDFFSIKTDFKTKKNTNYYQDFIPDIWKDHNFNPTQKCPICIANTIKAVGNKECKKFRTRCIFTYPMEMRYNISKVTYRFYPHIFSKIIIDYYHDFIDKALPPIKRTGKARQKARKADAKLKKTNI